MMTPDEAAKRVDDARAYLHIDDRQAELADLEGKIAEPDFWNDTERAQRLSKQAADVRDLLARYDAAVSLLGDIQTACELAEEDPAFADELESDLERLERKLDEFEVESWFSGP